MTFNEIEQAIGQHLALIANGTPIAWPNKDYDPAARGVPYFEFRHSPIDRVDDTGTGDYGIQSGIALVTVVSNRNTFTTAANGLAQQVANGFKKGLRLAAGGGFVLINAPSSVAPGFVDGVYWRQPVSVSYITEGS